MTNARIVVAQTKDYVRDNLAVATNMSPNDIVYTGDSGEALKLVSEGSVDAVVTGRFFYPDAIVPGSSVVTGPSSGRVLAEKIKEESPSTLVLRYSVTPGKATYFDADVPRSSNGGDDVLVDLLNAVELGDLVSERDFDGLKERFPDISWYASANPIS